jgi:hypothetical protein
MGHSETMRISIMQPGYLPWLGFFELIANCELFVLLDDVQYNVKFWRNRNKIRTARGWMWLTVPVLHKGRRQQLIKDVKINNTQPWQKKHLHSLEINYAKARFFNAYISFFRTVYERTWFNLFDLDNEIIHFFCREFGISTPLVRSSSLEIEGETGNQRILAICKKLNASILYDSAGARPFIDQKLFLDNGVNVIFQEYRHPEYRQAYQPFLPNMSALDLLFNEGEGSRDIILSGTGPGNSGDTI